MSLCVYSSNHPSEKMTHEEEVLRALLAQIPFRNVVHDILSYLPVHMRLPHPMIDPPSFCEHWDDITRRPMVSIQLSFTNKGSYSGSMYTATDSSIDLELSMNARVWYLPKEMTLCPADIALHRAFVGYFRADTSREPFLLFRSVLPQQASIDSVPPIKLLTADIPMAVEIRKQLITLSGCQYDKVGIPSSVGTLYLSNVDLNKFSSLRSLRKVVVHFVTSEPIRLDDLESCCDITMHCQSMNMGNGPFAIFNSCRKFHTVQMDTKIVRFSDAFVLPRECEVSIVKPPIPEESSGLKVVSLFSSEPNFFGGVLPPLPDLVSLTLYYDTLTSFGDVSLFADKLENLRLVDLPNHPPMTMLTAAECLPKLRVLYIRGGTVDRWPRMPALMSLSLINMDDGLNFDGIHQETILNLTHIQLCSVEFDNARFARIPMPKLSILEFAHCMHLSDELFRDCDFPSIEKIWISECPNITGSGWALMPTLHELMVIQCEKFSGVWFSEAASFGQSHKHNTSVILQSLDHFTGCLKIHPTCRIHKLTIRYCHSMDDQFFTQELPDLHDLRIQNCPMITGDRWSMGTSGLQKMVIRIHDCDHFGDDWFLRGSDLIIEEAEIVRCEPFTAGTIWPVVARCVGECRLFFMGTRISVKSIPSELLSGLLIEEGFDTNGICHVIVQTAKSSEEELIPMDNRHSE